LAPSSLNWTPETVRRPTTVTLAVTGTVVPLTVAPEAGSVMETTRLPNCAWAVCGAIKLQPSSVDRAAA